MKVTFLNVGQGDSIILENDIEGEKEVGIIDCNLTENNINRVIEYLTNNKVSKISFLLISHPHTDHFSGYLELLNYIEQNSIKVNHFLITCYNSREYIESCLKFPQDKLLLVKIFLKAAELENIGLITKQYHISDAVEKNLFINHKFKFLSPSTKEIGRFIAKNYSNTGEENPTNKDGANLLSTCIKIFIDENKFIILTADLEKYSFKRIRDERESFNPEEKLLLGQVPHHGSLRNHDKIFWRFLNKNRPKDIITPIVISVGKNNYGHPDKKVIDELIDLDYNVLRTETPIQNQIKSKNLKIVSLLLNNHSTVINSNYSLGDKTFVF